MKTIKVTNEMYEALMEISKNMNSQDHRCTRMPYLYQVRDKVEVAAYQGCGESIWVNEDGNELRSELEIKDFVINHIYENHPSVISLDYKEALKQAKEIFETMYESDAEGYLIELNKGWREVEVTKEDVYKQAFFTEKACKEHIKYKKHHYNESDSFVTGFSYNQELETVCKFLCELSGGKLHT
jgi:hypothetical protein